jgi:nucleoid-associated protein YgaU
MKQNQITELKKLTNESYENIFNVYEAENGLYFYNLLQTVQFPEGLPPNLFTTYSIVYGDTWPFISFKTLKTPNLWWLILLANNINNPLEPLILGNTVRIPIASMVREVLSQIL